jgi:hypothetical protein
MTRPGSSRLAFLGTLFTFVTTGRRLWLLPVLGLLLLVSLLAVVGALAPYAAFLYPL